MCIARWDSAVQVCWFSQPRAKLPKSELQNTALAGSVGKYFWNIAAAILPKILADGNERYVLMSCSIYVDQQKFANEKARLEIIKI